MRALRLGRLSVLLATLLVVGGAAPAAATFPGKNGLIVWSRSFALQDSEIFVMNPDGSNRHQLSHNRRNDFFPAWSPDGQQLAFESSSATDVDIWVMQADATDGQNVSNDPSVADRGPAWSPDGRFIAFYKQRFDGTSSIWIMNANGGRERQLTEGLAADASPAWAPDGLRIVFSSDRDGNLELYTIKPDGTGLRRLTVTPGLHEENPNWSPDGERIAFDACRADSFPCPGSANYEIFVMRSNGGPQTRLTFVDQIDANPAWSPDGTEIVFRSDRSREGTEIWKMNADGSDQIQLTPGPFQGGVDPDWQPL